ncbi:MAG: winged helix-turn-helix transcriptional regulator [Verrucomicrobiae bacterium]|nr:winged helix-turn-helix transcriptional regulator [Verrucomicrobiae bacterium]
MKDTLAVYKCLCDETRLRILNLLNSGPLCVCHLQEILDESQVRVSKQLAYMKRQGMVTVTKHANWRIYQLPESVTPLLTENLKCLQDLRTEGKIFRADLEKLKRLDTSAACVPAARKSCCES